MKSQLESEQAAAEDLRKAAEGAKAKLDELRDEFRLRMQVCGLVRGITHNMTFLSLCGVFLSSSLCLFVFFPFYFSFISLMQYYFIFHNQSFQLIQHSYLNA